MEMASIVKEFDKDLVRQGIRTHADYCRSAENFMRYLEEQNLTVLDVTEALVEEYRRSLLEQRTKPTVNNLMGQQKRFFAFLQKRGLRLDNPFEDLENLRSGLHLPREILTPEEMGLLLDNWACQREQDIMLRSIAELQYGSSLRIAEAGRLKEYEVDWEGGSILVTDTKAGKQFRRPASEASLNTLRYYLKTAQAKLLTDEEREQRYLYPQKCATQLRCLLNAKLKRECLRLNLPVITSHAFRHASATHLLRAGAGIRHVQAMLGHVSIASTQIYTRVVKEDLRRTLNSCHPREGGNGGTDGTAR